MDRQAIERRDFPIGRRGYDTAAVDAHLERLADEFEALRRSAQRGAPGPEASLAGTASEHVRLIVEAAEQSAADLRREAELEARRLRQDAREHAERVRGEAGRQAREHVETVAAAARAMLERVESMQRELGDLTESLRAGTTRVNADLSLLSASVGELREASAAPVAGADPGAVETFEAGDEVEPQPAPAPVPAPEAVAPEPVADGAEGDGGTAGAGATADADEEGARLIALNLALTGTPREETERYLAENYDLADPQALLDDVYARAGQ